MQFLDLVQPVLTLHLDFGYKLLIMIANFSGNKNKRAQENVVAFLSDLMHGHMLSGI